MDFDIGGLADPENFQQSIRIDGYSPSVLVGFLRMMETIRRAERQLAKGRKDGLIGGPVHLGVGQEAVAVGISSNLRKSDRVFGNHRSHAHLLALGGEVRKLFAEVLGKETGFSKGMGGSMHLWDKPNGFWGSVPIVAGTVPIAVGAALAAKLQGTRDVGVSYLGDGAIEEGVVHESLNLAKILMLPAVFVVENNLFASHMHIQQRQPNTSTARFAFANSIPYKIVDGNDVTAVAGASAELINKVRDGGGPALIEVVTYRWYGHVDWREDIDVGLNRSTEDLNKWKKRDPIKRLRESMISRELWSDSEQTQLDTEIDDLIESSWNIALTDPFPVAQSLLSRVYTTGESVQ